MWARRPDGSCLGKVRAPHPVGSYRQSLPASPQQAHRAHPGDLSREPDFFFRLWLALLMQHLDRLKLALLTQHLGRLKLALLTQHLDSGNTPSLWRWP